VDYAETLAVVGLDDDVRGLTAIRTHSLEIT
jgi:hypothetical protein